MIETFPGASLGECRGSDASLFFPDRGEPIGQAKAVCARCLVLADCREYAILHEREGIWGGLGAKERRKERARRGITVDTPGDPYALISWLAEPRVAS